MRVLLVEDAAGLGEAVREQIADDGHAVDWVQRLTHARSSMGTTPYDLILLDLMLPDGSGLDFLRQQRMAGVATPVIILTAQDRISDRIDGLNAGADDYLVKPFDLFELSARVAAVARRYSGNPNPQINVAGLQIDMSARTVSRQGDSIELTAREWALFEAFIQRPSALLSKTQLEERLYAFGAEIESNTIEVYISRLRKKLGRDFIETVRGMGYRLIPT
ncbi:response regulator [Pseudomonas abietaniphila]|uniref:Two-component system, OmpR family, response regulator n=1 Tax=Pseudomonas abietaniphila TaxID=89065 RepID=A0A1G8KDA6_9PSED|nr:response regulator transcription factor [Pseudomonas abietaniphila]SDI41432.1 two-component system, OmpR family, response regulator [Pseudomonas abietaniphila]